MIVTELHAVPAHTYGANEEILAKNAADLLNKHYPNHLWAVFVDSEGGILVIKNFSVSYRYGYVLHIAKLDPELKRVVRAGGEILERARMKRGSWDGQNAQYVEGVAQKHQPFRGIIV